MSTVFSVTADQSFGALVSFGIGGVATELLDDLAYRSVPLTDVDAAELITAPRAAPLLYGYRGGAVVDRAGLVDLALRLSALADDLPEIGRAASAARAGRPRRHRGDRSDRTDRAAAGPAGRAPPPRLAALSSSLEGVAPPLLGRCRRLALEAMSFAAERKDLHPNRECRGIAAGRPFGERR